MKKPFNSFCYKFKELYNSKRVYLRLTTIVSSRKLNLRIAGFSYVNFLSRNIINLNSSYIKLFFYDCNEPSQNQSIGGADAFLNFPLYMLI